MKTPILAGMAAAVLALSSPALAQEMKELVTDDKPKEVKKKDGWDFLLVPGASVSMTDNHKVVGQPEGLSLTLGAQLKAGALFRSGDHQFRANLDITETYTRTPIIDKLIKSTDIFKFEALYLYNILDWLGPYVRFSLNTNMIEGFAVQPDFARWRIVDLDGSEEFRTAREVRLTDWFSPLQLRESAGFFLSPWQEKYFNFEFRLGFGALHMLAKDQYAVADDGATDEIDIVELDSFNQAGGEAALTISGELYEKKLVYKFTAEAMVPWVNDLREDDDRSAFELTNVELNFSLSYKMLKWLSLDYVFRLVRVPQLIDETQVQNNLLLTASWSLFEPEKEEK